jgi:hypothetical protein
MSPEQRDIEKWLRVDIIVKNNQGYSPLLLTLSLSTTIHADPAVSKSGTLS